MAYLLLKTNRFSVLGAVALGIFSLVGSAFAGAEMPATAAKTVDVPEANQKLSAKQLSFLENAGQWNAKAEFLLKASDVDFWVTKHGFVLDFKAKKADAVNAKFAGHAVHVNFVGSSEATVTGKNPMSVTRDYIQGQTRKIRAKGFGEVQSANLYPGIGLRSYVDGGAPRYDIEVAPNADPSQVAMEFNGASKVSVLKTGDVAIGTAFGDKKMVGLAAFQTINGKKVSVPAKFTKLGDNRLGFKLGAYDASKKLVIDPLIYGSYYGGDDGPDTVTAVTSDVDGGVYLTGKTRASQFPATFGPYGFNIQGGDDAFITKLQGDAYLHDYAALFGGTNNDVGTRIQLDPSGNVWIAGLSNSLNFPGNTRDFLYFFELTSGVRPNTGTFRINVFGQQTTALPFNATPAQVQAALEVILGAGNVTVTIQSGTGSMATGAIYKVVVSRSIGAIPTFTFDNSGMEPRYGLGRFNTGSTQILRTRGTTAPTGGFYTLSYKGNVTAPLAFNATADQVQAALHALPELDATNLAVTSAATPSNPALPPYLIQVNVADNPVPRIVINGTTLTGGLYEVINTDSWGLFWDNATTRPTGGTFNLTFRNQTAGFNFNANAAAITTGLTALPAVGAGNVLTGSFIAANLPDALHQIVFVGDLAGVNTQLLLDDRNLQPKPTFGSRIPSDIFAIRFAKEGSVLNPLPSQTLIFGGDGDDTLVGFSMLQVDNPNANTQPEFILCGNSEFPIQGLANASSGGVYFARHRYDGSSFDLIDNASGYFTDSAFVTAGGAVLDREGNMVIGGQVSFTGNVDTSLNPSVFRTTATGIEGARLLRNNDLFIRKFSSSGALIYSILLGGNNSEQTGGFLTDMTGLTYSVGSTVAVDLQGNAYITGVTGSFNYPRTRGVYGEVFDNRAIVVVSKVNGTGTSLVYSTNLRTASEGGSQVRPAGIAVDQAGNAHVTGNLRPFARFPENDGNDPADPNRPVTTGNGTVPVTPDALDPDLTMPDAADLPTNEGFYTVLNNTATNLIYSSYVGGILDDFIHGPYVDSFGDSWICGSTDSVRDYTIVSSTGTGTRVLINDARLPDSMITPLAFKANPDRVGAFAIAGIQYGALPPVEEPANPPILAWLPSDTAPFQTARTLDEAWGPGVYQRDGFVVRQRVSFPAVDALALGPNTVPGGLGANSIATFTLSAPAPAGGADVSVTLSNGAVASFANGADQTALEFTIPAGQTTATFPVYSKAVNQNSTVDVRATYLGSFKIARLNVVPWLQQLGITPTEVVGGNAASGRITLAAAAPAGGVTVDLLTDNSSVISFAPNPTTVTIPAGQQTGTFTINTTGVGQDTFPTITASLLGVGRSQSITVRPVTPSSITFNPSRVAGGSTTIGTVQFSGRTGGAFNLKVTLNSGTGGYRFRASEGSAQVAELILPVPANVSSVSFFLDTKFEAVNTQRIARAQMLNTAGVAVGPAVSGTIFVDAVNLTAFTIDPTTILGGGTVEATVSIGSPAPEGGVVLTLESSKPAVAPVDPTVTVLAGQTSVTFNIQTKVVFGTNESVGFKVRRGSLVRSANLNVVAGAFGLTLDPTAVTGGTQNSVGTVDIGSPAPAGGLIVYTRSSNTAAATVPNSITIPAGQQIGTFPITTRTVAVETPVTISAILGKITVTRTLTVNTTKLLNFTVSPNQLRPLRNALATVELATPAPAGGVVVDIQLNTSLFVVYPTTLKVTVPAGQTTATFVLQAKPLSINTRTVARASAGGTSIGVQLDIRR